MFRPVAFGGARPEIIDNMAEEGPGVPLLASPGTQFEALRKFVFLFEPPRMPVGHFRHAANFSRPDDRVVFRGRKIVKFHSRIPQFLSDLFGNKKKGLASG